MDSKIQSVKMYSTTWCADCIRTRMFFDEHDIKYEDIDIERNPGSATIVEKINNGNRSTPTIIVLYINDEEKILVEPSTEQLEEIFN